MARKTQNDNEPKAQNEPKARGRAHAPGQQKLHQLISPGGEVIEATQADFHDKYQGMGYIRAGDVEQDHLNADDQTADEPKPEPAEVEAGGEADAPDQLPVETDPPAGAQPDGKA